jgi:uncharacterized damage-inducible protein DinB
MFKQTRSDVPQLQAPGMGLPKPELFVARFLVGFKLRTTSQEQACRNFAGEAQRILSIAAAIDPEQAMKPVLIDRMRGLEDSSRFWSIYMTMEHLRIVNRSTIDVMHSLIRGIKPQIVVSTAAVKPKLGIDKSVMSDFRAVCDEFQAAFSPETDLQSVQTLAHPWFGELNARQWHFFAGFHMQLHRKQIMKILRQLP